MKKFLLSIVITISILSSTIAIDYNLMYSSDTLTIVAGDDEPPVPIPDSDYYITSLNTAS